MEKFVCIHAHFYQPPRENPWLEDVETEPSAAPFHDWNQRITKECYAPNTAARILGREGKIAAIINNYEKVSFNFGPTLLSWMERHEPEAYQKILEADRVSIRTRNGHGNAVAQVYNHSIMPLNSRRDKETQVIWGIKDFEFRFGRKPEGIWFAETAVDTESLAIAAAHGIKFTVLSPRQAKKVRPIKPGAAWTEVNGHPDPRHPYLYRPDDKHEIAIFFYDGDISHSIAFEGLLFDGVRLADLLAARFAPAVAGEAQLVHVATDGESYGHHHRFGEMALAAAVVNLEKRTDVKLTNYAEYLANHPPMWEADIYPESSWSCAHGVERWRGDCGCHTGGEAGWNQKWRGPLRAGLNLLKQAVDEAFEKGMAPLVLDPWEARNDYVEVCLKRSDDRLKGFFTRHQKTPLTEAETVFALKHLEMQKMAMRMFTSCGWFFTDISGIETVQILKYAARAADLMRELTGAAPEEEMLRSLAQARSNVKQHGTGADIYHTHVLPMRLNPLRLAAHSIIADSLAERPGPERHVYCYRVDALDHSRETYLDTMMGIGILSLTNTYTLESRKLTYCLLHFGMHDFNCFIHPFYEMSDYIATKEEVAETFRRRSVPEILRTVEKYFGQSYYTIAALFDDQRHIVMEQLTAPHLAEFAAAYEKIFTDSRALVDFYAGIEVSPPEEFKLAARYVFEKQLGRLFTDTAATGDHAEMRKILAEARRWGLTMKPARLETHLAAFLEHHAARIASDAAPGITPLLAAVLETATEGGLAPDLWRMQNLLYPQFLAWNSPSHPNHQAVRGTHAMKEVLAAAHFLLPTD